MRAHRVCLVATLLLGLPAVTSAQINNIICQIETETGIR